MTGMFKKAVLGTALAASTVVAVAPAEAQYYRGRRDRGGDVATGALVGGIVGLGLGAAIASSNRDRYYDRGYYYDRAPRGYYRQRYYAPPRAVYRERYYAPRGYYADPYYRPNRGYYGYYGY